MEVHYGKEYGGRAHEEPNSTRAQLVLDATALECTPRERRSIGDGLLRGIAAMRLDIHNNIFMQSPITLYATSCELVNEITSLDAHQTTKIHT